MYICLDLDGLKDVIGQSSAESGHDDDEREAPSLVVYLVEPFSFGSDQPELQRLSCLSLLRSSQSVLTAIPENIRSNISVQVRLILFVSFFFLLIVLLIYFIYLFLIDNIIRKYNGIG